MKFSTFLKGVAVAVVAKLIFGNKQDASPKKTPASTSGGAEGNAPPVEVQPANKQDTSQEKPPASTSGDAEGNAPPDKVQPAVDKPSNTTDVAKEVEDDKKPDEGNDKPKDGDISDKKSGQQDHLHHDPKK